LKRYLPALLVLMLAAVAFASCGDDDEASPSSTESGSPTQAELDKITFMAGFKAQANLPFVGVYVAKEKGFFAEQNLDVDVQHVTTPGDNFPLLASGRVQFSTSDAAELLNHRAGDPSLPLVSIALIGQTGQQGFAVLAGSGINTPEDWPGKTAGYKGATVPPDYLAILEATGVDRSSITEVRTGFDPAVLTEHQVDIWPVFLSNEPDTLRRAGYETKLFTAADYGAPTLGLTYVTTEDYAAENPDIARRFVAAALEGISYARDHRDEAIDIVLQYAPGADRDHQRFMLDTELDMAEKGVAPTGGIGYQVLGQWQALRDYLVQYNAIPGALPDIAKAFTVDFLPQAAGSVTPTP
jgi:ABC-type nitrate/sulfonate/bicarbonate transport system substrate-binding protein